MRICGCSRGFRGKGGEDVYRDNLGMNHEFVPSDFEGRRRVFLLDFV